MIDLVDCELCVVEREKMTLDERFKKIKGYTYYRGENHIVTKFTDNGIETLCGAEKLPPSDNPKGRDE